MHGPARRIVPEVVREHAETAAFQWAQRDTLAAEDPPDLEAIAHVDARLEAHLDALRIAGAAAWPFVIEAFETYPEKGELFVTAFLALETGDARRLEQAAAFARIADGGARGLCGAFEWLPPQVTREVVRGWIDTEEPVKCTAALAALAAHRVDPGTRLPRLLQHGDESVRAAAGKLAALLGR